MRSGLVDILYPGYAQTCFSYARCGGVGMYLAGEKRFALVFIACSFSRKRVTSIGYILGGKVDKSLDLKIRGR